MQSKIVSRHLQQLNSESIVSLYEIHTDDGIIRVHGGKTRYGNFVYWQGEQYVPIPLDAAGFEKKSEGTLNRPRIIIANIKGILSPIISANNNLTGLKLVRKRTFEKYLDGKTWNNLDDQTVARFNASWDADTPKELIIEGTPTLLQNIDALSLSWLYNVNTQNKIKIMSAEDVSPSLTNSRIKLIFETDLDVNFYYGLIAFRQKIVITGNPDANSSIQFFDEVYIINRKISETPQTIQFELTSPLDLPDVVLPKRKIYSDHCQWLYRGTECGYTGPDSGTASDLPINGRKGRPDLRFENFGVFRLFGSSLLLNKDTFTVIANSTKPPRTPQKNSIIYASSFGTVGTWDTTCPVITGVTTLSSDSSTGKNKYQINVDRNGRELILRDTDYLYVFVSPKDVCSKKLTGCKLRYGATGLLPFGGFPGAK